MDKWGIALLIALTLTGCSTQPPTQQINIETAMAETIMRTTIEASARQTLMAQITETTQAMATVTLEPTETPIVKPTQSDAELVITISNLLMKNAYIDTVNLVRINRVDGGIEFEIEVKTKMASRDRQPDISYQIIGLFGSGYTPENQDKRIAINLTTYSTLGEYKYHSYTSPDALSRIYGKQLSYDEWVLASGAGFVQ
jgi:hypothetical protein